MYSFLLCICAKHVASCTAWYRNQHGTANQHARYNIAYPIIAGRVKKKVCTSVGGTRKRVSARSASSYLNRLRPPVPSSFAGLPSFSLRRTSLGNPLGGVSYDLPASLHSSTIPPPPGDTEPFSTIYIVYFIHTQLYLCIQFLYSFLLDILFDAHL